MAASYHIWDAERIKYVKISGKTNYLELEQLFYRFMVDPLFSPNLRLLVDLRGLDDAVTGMWEIRKLKKLYQRVYSGREDPLDIVIVTVSGPANRVAKAFQFFMVDCKPLKVQVTKNFQEALDYLGLTENEVARRLAPRKTSNVIPLRN